MNTILQKFFIFCLSFFALISASLASTDSDALTQLLLNVHAMQADFVQKTYDQHGKVLHQSNGKMALVRPGRFRWEIESPNQQIIIANAPKLWIYDPDLEQVTIRPLSKASGQTPALLLSDSSLHLNRDFTVSKLPSVSMIANQETYLLKPIDADNLFEKVEIRFLNKTIQEMHLTDHLGNVTDIRFTHVSHASDLSPSLFEFTPPKNVDVIDETKHK